MSKQATIVLFSVLFTPPACAQDTSEPPKHIHWPEFKHKVYLKDALIKTAISAVWAEARNSPHEWGRTWEGLGKRAASSYAERVIKGATEFAISATLTHEDLRYHKSNQEGFFPRVKYAVVHTFWVPRDVGDGNTFAAGRVTGAFVAGQLSRTWMPSRVATFGAGIESGGLTIGLDAGLNVLKEFWPKKH